MTTPMKWTVAVASVLVVATTAARIAREQASDARLEPSRTGVAEAESEETSGWDSYRSLQYGFEVKYPREWTIEESVSSQPEVGPPAALTLSFMRANEFSGIILDVFERRSPSDALSSLPEEGTVTVSGIIAKRYARRVAPDIGGADIVLSTQFSNHGRDFAVYYVRNQGLASYEDTYERILQEFKLLD